MLLDSDSVLGRRIEGHQFGLDLTSHVREQPDGPPTTQVPPADLRHVGFLDRPRSLHVFGLVHGYRSLHPTATEWVRPLGASVNATGGAGFEHDYLAEPVERAK